jgi:hypothetical protein
MTSFISATMTHEAQRTACLLSENFPQILGKFETKHFANALASNTGDFLHLAVTI